jgi:transcription elongation factor Elf1
MDGEHTIPVTFECKNCGGNTLVLPDEATDESVVTCKSCGIEVANWGDIKNASVETVKAQIIEDLKDAFSGTDGFKVD